MQLKKKVHYTIHFIKRVRPRKFLTCDRFGTDYVGPVKQLEIKFNKFDRLSA